MQSASREIGPASRCKVALRLLLQPSSSGVDTNSIAYQKRSINFTNFPTDTHTHTICLPMATLTQWDGLTYQCGDGHMQ